MNNFQKAKLTSVARRREFEVEGVPLIRLPDDLSDHKLPIPIRPCFCVQDTPENPCICPEMTVYIPPLDIIRWERSKRSHEGGEEDSYKFFVPVTSTLSIEQPMNISTKGYEDFGNWVTYQKKGKGDIRKWLIRTAFSIGWAIGTALDNATGTSDAWGDLAEDHPAPDWLIDLYDSIVGFFD